MLIYVDICWYMLIYVDICWYMLIVSKGWRHCGHQWNLGQQGLVTWFGCVGRWKSCEISSETLPAQVASTKQTCLCCFWKWKRPRFLFWSISLFFVQNLAVSLGTSWADHGFYMFLWWFTASAAATQQEAFQNFPIQLILDIVLASGRPRMQRRDSVVFWIVWSRELHDWCVFFFARISTHLWDWDLTLYYDSIYLWWACDKLVIIWCYLQLLTFACMCTILWPTCKPKKLLGVKPQTRHLEVVQEQTEP